MRLYIAGPMTGIEHHNLPLFFETEQKLQQLGHETENPGDNDGPTPWEAILAAKEHPRTWADYMRLDIPRVMKSDAICVLPGWQNSPGARLETTVAKALGMPIMTLADGQLVPRVRAIGLSGYARAGKDTVAKILVEDYGYVQSSFAAKLKDAVLTLDPYIPVGNQPWRLSQLVTQPSDWEHVKGDYPESRRLLQVMGTEVGRNLLGDNIWVDLAMDSLPDGSKAVFSDARFMNEAAAIEAAGGQMWRISRRGYGPINGHISEVALDEYMFDVYINNNGSPEKLRTSIARLMSGVLV